MKLLLTSGGINNTSINNALVELLGKPIAESNALFIPTAIYPFVGGAGYAWKAITQSPLCQLGWKSVGVLELTSLPSIKKEAWLAGLEETDALLGWGGDPLYLAYWMKHSGLAELLPALLNKIVYVGVSAGSMAMCATFGETYHEPPNGNHEALTSGRIAFNTAGEEISRTFMTAHGVGLVDFALIPHFNNEKFADACGPNAEKWAAMLPVPVYAIDDQTAIKIIDGNTEVVSEGQWKLFTPAKQ